MDNTEILNNLLSVIDEYKGEDGWLDLARIGHPLNKKGIKPQALGYTKLRELLEDFPDDIEIKKDMSHDLPVYYARIKAQNNSTSKQRQKNTDSRKRNYNDSKLLDWAYMGDFRLAISNLKKIALDERWYYKEEDPAYPYPILSQYLIYTFFRLAKEGTKIAISEDSDYATFNTGLVNNLYQPIYALFQKNKRTGKQKWYFLEFCVSGTGKGGKNLARQFNPLPERANFFDNIADLIYDTKAPTPHLNWEHIILDNVNRLPFEFLEDNKPKNFILKDTKDMTGIERKKYYKELSNAIENDDRTFRSIKNRFQDSLNLALNRVKWNYKTAIPMYYPPLNKISLLLPLSLLDDDIIDLALVIEKADSGNYLGHTILPLSWAYSNARLITRPDSDWLIAEQIDSSKRNENSVEDED